MRKLLPIAVLMVFLLPACTPKRSHNVDFYYWKSKCAIGETERDYFNQLDSKRLFVRLFDVDIESGLAVPIGQIQSFTKDQLLQETEIRSLGPLGPVTVDLDFSELHTYPLHEMTDALVHVGSEPADSLVIDIL